MLNVVYVFIYIKTILLYWPSPPLCLLYCILKVILPHWTWKSTVVIVSQWWMKIYCGFTQVWTHEHFWNDCITLSFLWSLWNHQNHLFTRYFQWTLRFPRPDQQVKAPLILDTLWPVHFWKTSSGAPLLTPFLWGTLDYVRILSFSLSPPVVLCLEF